MFPYCNCYCSRRQLQWPFCVCVLAMLCHLTVNFTSPSATFVVAHLNAATLGALFQWLFKKKKKCGFFLICWFLFSLESSLLFQFFVCQVTLSGWLSVMSNVTSSKCFVDVLLQPCTLYYLNQLSGGTRSLCLPWGVPAVTTLGFLQERAPILWDAPTSWWTTQPR